MLHRLAEGRVAEGLAVVAEPDVVGQVPEAVPGVRAVADRLDDRDDQKERVEGECRREEEPDREPLSPETKNGRPRFDAAGRGSVEACHYFFLAAFAISATTCAGVALPANCFAIAPLSAWPMAAE